MSILDPLDPDARMNAYYYGFDRTGVGVIDAILSAVATAGKHYHHTENWSEEPERYDREIGKWFPTGEPSAVDQIQAAANRAAQLIRDALADKEAH